MERGESPVGFFLIQIPAHVYSSMLQKGLKPRQTTVLQRHHAEAGPPPSVKMKPNLVVQSAST